MIRRRLLLPILSLVLAHGLATGVAQACAVCFGDSESPMSKGVVAGVLVMIGFVGFVLAAVTGTGLYWMHRGRQLARSLNVDRSPDDPPD